MKRTELFIRNIKNLRKRKKCNFRGRLGEYKYYDMDAVIASALEMCEKELG